MKPWRLAMTISCLAAAFHLHGDSTTPRHLRLIKSLPGPPLILWAWEEPEDLRTLDPARAGVAFLAERIFLGASPQFIPRHQPIAVPDHIDATAVVRIETHPGFRDSESLRALTTRELLRVAALPRTRAFQIDFDATQSQQPFYADILRRIRTALPPNQILTITALASWCATPNSWLATLPHRRRSPHALPPRQTHRLLAHPRAPLRHHHRHRHRRARLTTTHPRNQYLHL